MFFFFCSPEFQICVAAVYAAKKVPQAIASSKDEKPPDNNDVWIPKELFNRTATANRTDPLRSSASNVNTRTSDQPRKGRSSTEIDKKQPKEDESDHAKQKKSGRQNETSSHSKHRDQTKSTPKAEALRGSTFTKKVLRLPPQQDASLIDHQMALFSVDSWMGNLCKLNIG